MSNKTLGYLVQLGGCVALAAAIFYAGNLVKALVLIGAGALVVGRYLRTSYGV